MRLIKSVKLLFFPLLLLSMLAVYTACDRSLGYGVLLWADENNGIPSGTILKVFIRSNIDKVYVVGIPPEYRDREAGFDKAEIPLPLLDVRGSRIAAEKAASEFSTYAATYAEVLQDGLPVRENPDNSARRVYRLRGTEIIKILSRAEGNPAISAAGTPLPGDWYRVLTEDGSRGYCFSYRLKLFEHTGGQLSTAVLKAETAREYERDTGLENILSKTWVAERYGTMLREQKLDIDELAMGWGFFPGEDTGLAHIFLPDFDFSYQYSAIQKDGDDRKWKFEGARLSMRQRNDSTITVTWNDNTGYERNANFITLATPLADLILQETNRRDEAFSRIYSFGPIYRSANYGTIAFEEGGNFAWSGFQRLVPTAIPEAALTQGRVDMRLYLDAALVGRYDGALTLHFNVVSGTQPEVNFMYTLDRVSSGLRLEYIPQSNIQGVTVLRRTANPLIIYLYNEG
jgi:hypothetical protein